MSGDGSLNLPRSLRAFLAHSRNGDLTPTLCQAFAREVTACAGSAGNQTLRSAYASLRRTKDLVPTSDWQHLENALFDVLDDSNPSVANSKDSTNLRKRASSAAQTLSNKRPRTNTTHVVEDEINVQQRSALYLNSFYLLKSENSPATEHSIALDEVVLAGADLAVVCNYKFDVSWMWNHAPALQTSRKVLIVHGGTVEDEIVWTSFLTAEGASDRVRFARPKTPTYGTVHSKMILLFFPSGCRICIHTANMIECDWEFKTQVGYMRDFPLAQTHSSQFGTDARRVFSDFHTQLHRYFTQTLQGSNREEVHRALEKFDFSSAGVALVTSIPGVHLGASKIHFGHARLRELLKREPIEHRDASVALCQFSSLGSIQSKWLDEEFKTTLFASARHGSRNNASDSAQEIKLVYPTVQQVRQSNEGLQAGAALLVTPKNLNRDHIRNKLHKWDGRRSGRETAMPHMKSFLRYPVSRPESPYWIFVGSFNLSVAAWGRMQGKKAGRPSTSWDRLNILSYEVGVLFSPHLYCPAKHVIGASVLYGLLSAEDEEVWRQAHYENSISIEVCRSFQRISGENTIDIDIAPATNVQRKVVIEAPIPYQLPPNRYEPEDQPWTTDFCTVA